MVLKGPDLIQPHCNALGCINGYAMAPDKSNTMSPYLYILLVWC